MFRKDRDHEPDSKCQCSRDCSNIFLQCKKHVALVKLNRPYVIDPRSRQVVRSEQKTKINTPNLCLAVKIPSKHKSVWND